MKTKQLLLIISSVILLFGFNACIDLGDCVHGNGSVTTEVREVPSFDKVASEGSFEVQIVLGDKNEVVVEAESNLMYYIQTRVEGNKLVIKTRSHRCINSGYPIIVTVTTTDLEEITLSGSGSITATDIVVPDLEIDLIGSGEIDIAAEIDNLDARISGSGELTLVGNAYESELRISGSGSIRAYDFEHERCFATISGSGNMYVFINEFLDVRITGSGSVYYLGDPELNTSVTGSGSIINAN